MSYITGLHYQVNGVNSCNTSTSQHLSRGVLLILIQIRFLLKLNAFKRTVNRAEEILMRPEFMEAPLGRALYSSSLEEYPSMIFSAEAWPMVSREVLLGSATTEFTASVFVSSGSTATPDVSLDGLLTRIFPVAIGCCVGSTSGFEGDITFASFCFDLNCCNWRCI